jgi:hypothetical protein
MVLIAHRGNINGTNGLENKPSYICLAISYGYDVEVDAWYDGGWWLGHDKPTYKITLSWIKDYGESLWIHCKNLSALERMVVYNDKRINYFWHQEDSFTLTSHQWIWAYPGQPLTKHSICVLPEISNSPYERKALKKCGGICSNYIERYNDL